MLAGLCRAALVLAFALQMLPAVAQLELVLEDSRLTQQQRAVSQSLLRHSLQLLPPAFVQRLNRQVRVSWQADLPEDVWGQTLGPKHIRLNQRGLMALLDDQQALAVAGRSHASVAAEITATLLHELAHLYDRANWQPADLRRRQQYCALLSAHGPVGLPAHCRGQQARRFSISDDPRFLDLAGWPQQVGQRGAREALNGRTLRSPDAYELSHPREFFAVNFEYFLLDPSYSCRRPAMARYLQQHFAWTAPQASCEPTLAYLNAGLEAKTQPFALLDPARLYEVDYLLAEPNQAWMSRWGHSMLRLVICAPQREPGPACRLDLEHHLVLSFRAFVSDVQLSSWDGLTGVYPSRLFILPLAQVLDEYNKVELRGLVSVPLKLSPRQRLELLEQALELHWSYDGDYYFVSNNCAVESLKLLRAGTALPSLHSLDSLTPTGLLELLRAQGLARTEVLADPQQAQRLGYRFDSYALRYQAMFEVAKSQLNIPQDSLEDWLQSPAAVRRQWFTQADMRALAALLVLEQAIMRRQLLAAQQALKLRYLQRLNGPNQAVHDSAAALKEILAQTAFMSQPAQLLSSGYGLPQPSDWAALEAQSAARYQALLAQTDALDQQLLTLLSAQQRDELTAVEANLRVLGTQLRSRYRPAQPGRFSPIPAQAD